MLLVDLRKKRIIEPGGIGEPGLFYLLIQEKGIASSDAIKQLCCLSRLATDMILRVLSGTLKTTLFSSLF